MGGEAAEKGDWVVWEGKVGKEKKWKDKLKHAGKGGRGGSQM